MIELFFDLPVDLHESEGLTKHVCAWLIVVLHKEPVTVNVCTEPWPKNSGTETSALVALSSKNKDKLINFNDKFIVTWYRFYFFKQ